MPAKPYDATIANVVLVSVAVALVALILQPVQHKHASETAYTRALTYASKHDALPDWCATARTDSEVEACDMVSAWMDDNPPEESSQ